MSIKGTIEIVGLSDMIADAKQAGAVGADKLVRAALVNSTTEIQRQARVRAPHRTGTLQRSILPEINYPSALVAVNEKYGLFLEEGVGPFVIYPKNKKALFWKGALHPVKKVNHPGIKARPFFWPGVQASQGYIGKQFDTVLIKLTQALAGKAKV